MHPVVAAIFAPAPFLTAGLGWLWLGLTEISRNVADPFHWTTQPRCADDHPEPSRAPIAAARDAQAALAHSATSDDGPTLAFIACDRISAHANTEPDQPAFPR
jgi:hypothetical protein